ncbi:hypothetical protein [Pseudomonas alabamensis]|uniref:hypothetical protein n=1 Tax=Pseudomonas alabamensis TaxID=3064349 RepID=UPI0011A34753
MPTENRSSSNHGTRTFTLDSLTAALEQVQAFHEISADLIAESVFGQPAQQGQGEPVALPARRPWNGLGNAADNLKASGWNACLDKIVELGPLYTHADPTDVAQLELEIEQLRFSLTMNDCASVEDDCVRDENRELRAQLDEAQELLRAQDELLSQAYQHDIGTPLKRQIRAAALSASAEPSVRATFVDLIEDAEAEARRMVEQEGRTPRQAFPTELILRNAALTFEALSHAAVKPVAAEPIAPVEIDERAEFGKALLSIPYLNEGRLDTAERFWMARAALARKP